MHFKAKVTTPFRKLMTAYCERQSVAAESVVFLYEGERLRGEHTPQDVRCLPVYLMSHTFNSFADIWCKLQVDMEDGDSIDVVIHQVGGSMI